MGEYLKSFFPDDRSIVLANGLRVYEELENEIKQLTGFNLESLKRLFMKGYTLQAPAPSGSLTDMIKVDEEKKHICTIINYIDQRLDSNPYEGSWIDDQGKRISADVGYAFEWWRDCMKPELLRKFEEKNADVKECFGHYYGPFFAPCEDGAAGLCSYCVECQEADPAY